MQNVVEIVNVVKDYPGVRALNNVDFCVEYGEIRALLGKNGAGKSTLIRMLTGVEAPASGGVFIEGKALTGSGTFRTRKATQFGVSPVYQELSLVQGMSVAENIFIGHWPRKGFLVATKYMYRQARAVIDELGFTLNERARVSSLSPAECQMVEISRAMARASKLIILDEPTSSLSHGEVRQLFVAIKRLAEAGVAVLYVSHRMNEIREIAKTATIMRDGEIIANVVLHDTNNNQVIRLMLGAESQSQMSADSFTASRCEPVLSLRNIVCLPKLQNLSLDLHRGEILGLAGLLGSGRTEILNLIAGLSAPREEFRGGKIIYNNKLINKWSYRRRIKNGLALTPEDRKNDGIFSLLGIDENTVIANWNKVTKLGFLSQKNIDRETNKIIDSMSIKTKSTREVIGNLSGGNQQKIVIGRWIYARANILLLDEPTRGIDVEAKYQIYALCRYLSQMGIAIIFVSSEIEELPLVCQRILVLKDGALRDEFISPNIDTEKLLSACIG